MKLLRELEMPPLPPSKAHFEWLSCERELLRSLAGLYSHKYLFEIKRIVLVSNPELERAYEQRRKQIVDSLPAEDDAVRDAGAKEHFVFHGAHRNRLLGILREGLRAGKPSAHQNDRGYFGDRTRGVYVTKCADTAMYYTATPEYRPKVGPDETVNAGRLQA